MKKNLEKAPAPGPSIGAIPAHILRDARRDAKYLRGERIALFYDSGADHEEYYGYGPESAVDLLFNRHLGFVLGFVNARGEIIEAPAEEVAERAAAVALLNPYRPAPELEPAGPREDAARSLRKWEEFFARHEKGGAR